MLNETLLFHQSLGPRVFLSFSLSFFLSLSQANSLECRSPLSSLSCLGLQDPRERVPCAYVKQCKPRVKSFIGFLHKPRNIGLFLSFISYHRLWTTRFRSIKGPQQSVVLFLQLCAQNVLYSFSLTLFGSEASQRSYASVVVLPFLLFYI